LYNKKIIFFQQIVFFHLTLNIHILTLVTSFHTIIVIDIYIYIYLFIYIDVRPARLRNRLMPSTWLEYVHTYIHI